uniref:Metallothionein-like protein n=1 Tax=Tamarix androssowii TaxID=189785 RepID=Q6IV93_9CARY|nr:metallothionein [Tamarix androssowii]
MSSCGGSCKCSGCSCGDSCNCRSYGIEVNPSPPTIIAGVAPVKTVSGKSSEMNVEGEGCKCGDGCSCDPCTC